MRLRPIVLIGDSHTRSYVNRPRVSACWFLSSGKKLNFQTHFRSSLTFLKVFFAAFYLKIIGADFGLVLGEPDVRFSAYGSWNGYDENCADFDFPVLDLSAKRYVFMISMLKKIGLKPRYIVGVGSPNLDLQAGVHEFNQIVSSAAKLLDIPLFNPMLHVFSRGAFNTEMVSESVFDSTKVDKVHLSKAIGAPLDCFMLQVLNISEGVSFNGGFFLKWDTRFNVYRFRFLV